MEYSGNDDLVGESMYEFINNRVFYYKNVDFSSHVLHPFMYNLKLWNKLDNIIINGYKDYVDTDLISYLSSNVKFDELVGEFGECKNFWKYNVTDLTGYTTRYEASVKDEHKDDANRTTSELTGYDGLFYPDAAKDWIGLYASCLDGDMAERSGAFDLPKWFFEKPESTDEVKRETTDEKSASDFIWEMYSIFWQIKYWNLSGQLS